MLEHLLTSKGVKAKIPGEGVMRAGEGTIRGGEGVIAIGLIKKTQYKWVIIFLNHNV